MNISDLPNYSIVRATKETEVKGSCIFKDALYMREKHNDEDDIPWQEVEPGWDGTNYFSDVEMMSADPVVLSMGLKQPIVITSMNIVIKEVREEPVYMPTQAQLMQQQLAQYSYPGTLDGEWLQDMPGRAGG